MENYREMYYELFNKVTDVIEQLKEIQCTMEDKFAEPDETPEQAE